MSEIAKEKWQATQERHRAWWRREGFVLSRWTPYVDGACRKPRPAGVSLSRYWNDVDMIAERVAREAACTEYPGDIPPIADFSGWGPGTLAMYLGSKPDFAADTVWFFPREDDTGEWPPFRFDPDNEWWLLHEKTLKALVKAADGRYLIGCPDLVENLDTLASLREIQLLMIDMIERPEWVEEKIREINGVWFEIYRRIRDIVAAPDGSSAYQAFGLWGDGRTAKLQCDASAMISEEMFDRFVLPSLSEQAAWLDNALYHLDGTQAIRHLDSLLSIPGLDAIEWTPQAGIEDGGDPRWYELYRRILAAGKAVQAVHVRATEVIPLLDAVGTKGVYLHLSGVDTAREFEEICDTVRKRF